MLSSVMVGLVTEEFWRRDRHGAPEHLAAAMREEEGLAAWGCQRPLKHQLTLSVPGSAFTFSPSLKTVSGLSGE